MLQYVWFITLLVSSLYLVYALIPTMLIRFLSIGITKQLPDQAGVLLTFDDGPHPLYTPLLLDLLKETNVKAIFFVVGELANKYPEIIIRMHREGHAIGIHHYRHVSSCLLTPWALKRELVETEEVIKRLTKQAIDFYRPPWGHFNIMSLPLARKYKIIMWSHIYKDWLVTKNNLHLLAEQPPEHGAILLLHDNGDTSGADEKAPEVMLAHVKQFIYGSNRRNIPFINPENIQKRRL